jgi:N-formylglutamate deformylase
MSPPVVLHLPHSAHTVPADLRPTLVVSDERLAHELLVMTDWFTDELFALPRSEALAVRFPVSRLIVDPERFADDAREPMASRGMGVIYTRTSQGARLREPPSPSERAGLIARYYEPHHAALAAAVGAAADAHGSCLLVDCHSFPSRPLPCDLDQAPARPDICLGTDSAHTPRRLVDRARDLFETAGLDVAVDRPYSGVMIPNAYTGRAIMVEVNRRLYLNERTAERLDAFARVAAIVRDALRGLIADRAS